MAGSVLELGGLPVRTVSPALSDELQVAVEAFEARRALRRRHLALQIGFGTIRGLARGFGHRQRDRSGTVVVVASTTAPKHCSGCDYHTHSGTTAEAASNLHDPLPLFAVDASIPTDHPTDCAARQLDV